MIVDDADLKCDDVPVEDRDNVRVREIVVEIVFDLTCESDDDLVLVCVRCIVPLHVEL